jgi:uncharacterized protein
MSALQSGRTPLGCAVYYQHAAMIELLGRHSCDVWELTYAGRLDRLREVLREEPERARVVASGHTPLMWLPSDDEMNATEIARLLIGHGADGMAGVTREVIGAFGVDVPVKYSG